MLDVPFCIADDLAHRGRVRRQASRTSATPDQAADFDIKRAEQGIIYIDGIDKTTRKSGDNPSITRDVSSEGVQQALLKLSKDHSERSAAGRAQAPHQEFIRSTRKILFICGTFDQLGDHRRRVGAKGALGFGVQTDENRVTTTSLLHQVAPEDLIKFGMIPNWSGACR